MPPWRPASDRERRKGAHRKVNVMQGMVPMWDTRVARAYNRDEVQDVTAEMLPPTSRAGFGRRAPEVLRTRARAAREDRAFRPATGQARPRSRVRRRAARPRRGAIEVPNQREVTSTCSGPLSLP